jgi:hypothetical protein
MSKRNAIDRKRIRMGLFGASIAVLLGCGRTRDMPERVEMNDSTQVRRAMQNARAADSMMDTMPGGKMARGDSAATMQLLKKKM